MGTPWPFGQLTNDQKIGKPPKSQPKHTMTKKALAYISDIVVN
jgi:hypothetical protein